MGADGNQREARGRRRVCRAHRILRLLSAVGAAAVAGCAFGVMLTAVARAGQRIRVTREITQQQTHKEDEGEVSRAYADKILIRSPFLMKNNDEGKTIESSSVKGNCSVAQELWEEVRVLCWVMTRPMNHASKAAAVKETWGKRCNSLLFVSTVDDASLPAVRMAATEGRNSLWDKTRAAYTYLYKKGYLSDQVDWVLKADDDTFVVMENLRYLLSHYDPDKTVYLGLHFKAHLKQGFMSGGTGYVLSRVAARRFVTEGLPGNNTCRNYNQKYEDVEMGRCMAALGAKFVDALESGGRHRFFPYQPERHLNAKGDSKLSWLRDYLSSPMKKGTDCCSRNAISFHYISPSRMREMYYLVYHLTPYGIRSTDDTVDQVTHDTNTADDILDIDGC